MSEIELPQSRTRTSKTYQIDTNTFRLKKNVGGLPMHYLKDGKLEDIELTSRADAKDYVFDKAP